MLPSRSTFGFFCYHGNLKVSRGHKRTEDAISQPSPDTDSEPLWLYRLRLLLYLRVSFRLHVYITAGSAARVYIHRLHTGEGGREATRSALPIRQSAAHN